MLSPRRQAGLTLVELAVAVAVIAIGARLAAPEAAEMIANNKVRGTAQGILDALNLARAEAVRRNAPVRFTLQPGGAGWTVTHVASGQTLQSSATSNFLAVEVTPGGAASAVTFLPTGLLQAGDQLSQITVTSAVPDATVRRINIFGGGLIRMCDPAVSTAHDPRRC